MIVAILQCPLNELRLLLLHVELERCLRMPNSTFGQLQIALTVMDEMHACRQVRPAWLKRALVWLA